MLKPLHFVTGLGALLLAIFTYVSNPALQAGSLLLLCVGFMHLLLAPLLPAWNTKNRAFMQTVVFLLLLAAVLVQSASLLISSLPEFGLATVLLGAAATLVQLFLHRDNRSPLSERPVSSATQPFARPRDPVREQGTVKWFNTTKGFGFISRDGGDDIFVHFRAILGEGHRFLSEGQRVEYDVVPREKGLQAEDVVVLED